MENRGNLIAKILLSGDDHLKSSNYGQHLDYAKESFYYFKLLGDYCRDNNITHWIGLGDLTYGNFKRLEYREQVEAELLRQNEILKGNRWILKGNHDAASSGMTEYEYLLKKGYFRTSERLEVGPLNINMIDYGKHNETPVVKDETKTNIILTHGFYAFKGGKMNFGAPVLLDDMHEWYGIRNIICGHIHTRTVLQGVISDGKGNGCTTIVHYLPCLARPAYFQNGENPEQGQVVVLDVYENSIEYNEVQIDLLPLSESFNLERILEEQKEKEAFAKLDLQDIVTQLAGYNFNHLNTEDIIMGNPELSQEVKLKACEFLKAGAGS